MIKIIIKKWKTGQIAKSYEYLVDNEEQFLITLLNRDKQRGYYRHIGEMNTCIDINPAGDAHSCMNYQFGIQLCDNKDNFKSYRIDYPINPPKKQKRTKTKEGLSKESFPF